MLILCPVLDKVRTPTALGDRTFFLFIATQLMQSASLYNTERETLIQHAGWMKKGEKTSKIGVRKQRNKHKTLNDVENPNIFVCNARAKAVFIAVVMWRFLFFSDSCPSWVWTDWKTGRTISRTEVQLMASFLRTPGTEWPREQSAASGRHPPSTICECLSMLCLSSARPVPNETIVIIYKSVIAFSWFITVPLTALFSVSNFFIPAVLFYQDGFVPCRAASSKAKDRTAKEGTQQGSQKDNAYSGT